MLLPVTVDVLRTLPLSTPPRIVGVPMSAKDALLTRRYGSSPWDAALDLSDELVRAVVAARIARPWLRARPVSEDTKPAPHVRRPERNLRPPRVGCIGGEMIPDWARGIAKGETVRMLDPFRLTAAGAQRALGDASKAGMLVSIHAKRSLDDMLTVDIWEERRGPPHEPIARNMDAHGASAAVEPG